MAIGRKESVCVDCNKEFKAHRKNVQRCPLCRREYNRKRSYNRRLTGLDVCKYQVSRFLILKRDNFKCAYCGLSAFEDKIKLNVDHIVSVKDGGTDLAENLITSCTHCNFQKNSDSLNEDVVSWIKKEVRKRNDMLGIAQDKVLKIDNRNKS